MQIDPEIGDAVIALVAAKVGEWPAMVHSRPKLLSTEAEEYLRISLSNVPPGMTPEQVTKVHDAYGLVKRCRDLGPEAALVELDLKVRKPELAKALRIIDFVPNEGTDPDERVEHYERALKLLEPGDDAILRARLQNNLAGYLTKAKSSEQSRNLERAIDLLQEASEVFTERRFPDRWAALQAHLANAFVLRKKGDLKENLVKALYFFDEAIRVFTKETKPALCAKLMESRALAEKMRAALGKHSDSAR